MSLTLPAPDQSLLARRNEIVAALRRRRTGSDSEVVAETELLAEVDLSRFWSVPPQTEEVALHFALPESDALPVKRLPGLTLNPTDHQLNLLQAHARARAEQANTVLKMTFKALRRVSLCPWRIGDVTAAALVLFHHEKGRTV